MSVKAKKYIQSIAWEKFPARELWYRNDNFFWAFDIQDEKIISTEGQYENGDVTFQTFIYNYNNEDDIQSLVDQKLEEGFSCFAIELSV